jgi:hypothetical protein
LRHPVLVVALVASLASGPALAARPRKAGRSAVDARIAEAVHGLVPTVSELRELEALREVPVLVQEPDELRAELLADAHEPREVQALEETVRALKVFGLLPDGLDLDAVVSDVLTEHVGGFYDPDDLRLVLVRRREAFTGGEVKAGSEDGMVAAHELVHALQDQHFDLWRMTNRDFASDDVELALHALVEGDASWAMLRFTAGGLDALGAGIDDTTFATMVHAGDAAPPSASMARLPRVLRDALVFPYLDGLVFARALQRARGWEGVDAAFATPPLSSEQVIHPEKYLAGDDPPLRLDLPDLAPALGAGWSTVDENGLGELGTRSVLRQRGVAAATAATASAGWGGDTYAVLQHADGALAAVWASAWDTDADAAEAAEALGGLGWEVEVDGRRVLVLVGVPEDALEAVRAQVASVAATPFHALDEVSTIRPEPRAADKVTAP